MSRELLSNERRLRRLESKKLTYVQEQDKLSFEFVNIYAFDEILFLNSKKHEETDISVWVWKFFYCDHFRSSTIFYYFRIRTFFLRHGDKFIKFEIVIFVVRLSKRLFLHLESCFSVQHSCNSIFFKRLICRSRLTERMKTARWRWLRLSSVLFNIRSFRS